jgi:hypothetical protein
VLEWNKSKPVGVGQTRKAVMKELTTIEKISIVGISVSVVSLVWSMYTFNCKKACK